MKSIIASGWGASWKPLDGVKQMRKETMREAGYTYVRFDKGAGLHVLMSDLGRLELFAANKGHASWGIRWRNTDLEFCRSVIGSNSGPIIPR